MLARASCVDGHAADALGSPASTCARYGSRVEIVLLARRAGPISAAIAASSGSPASGASQPWVSARARKSATFGRPMNGLPGAEYYDVTSAHVAETFRVYVGHLAPFSDSCCAAPHCGGMARRYGSG